MRGHVHFFVAFLIIAALWLAACGGQPTPAPPTTDIPPGSLLYSQAVVDGIDILILESFPVQVNVIAHGNLPDGCTQIDEIRQQRDGNSFQVTIIAARPAGAVCTEVVVPWEKTIGLGVYGLPAGTYTVDVSGVMGTFDLAIDNVPQREEPLPVLSWHREGGIAGFCDDLLVYNSGAADTAVCQGGSAQKTTQYALSAAQLEQLQAWLAQYQAFQLEQTDPTTADAMTIRMSFSGAGTTVPTDTDKQEILDFAAALYAEFSSGQ
jgi:hypothetical protein